MQPRGDLNASPSSAPDSVRGYPGHVARGCIGGSRRMERTNEPRTIHLAANLVE